MMNKPEICLLQVMCPGCSTRPNIAMAILKLVGSAAHTARGTTSTKWSIHGARFAFDAFRMERFTFQTVHRAFRGLSRRARDISMQSTGNGRLYALKPLPRFGVEVCGIDLKEHVNDDIIKLIKEDVTR